MNSTAMNKRHFSLSLFLKEFFYGFITEYETQKIVMIHSYSIAALLRIMQIILLLYSIFYLFLYERGYQKQDTSIISSVTLKVKGIGQIFLDNNQTSIFDGTDYIIPASENNAIFIMTNFIQTDQTRAQCSEQDSITEAKCTKDKDCQSKNQMPYFNGRWTGRCLLPSIQNVSYSENRTKGLCELEGWCPTEDDHREPTIIHGVLNFTIFIKNFIEFPVFQIKHRNIRDNAKPCVYDPVNETECPIFRLDYILRQAEKDEKERDLLLRLGGVIRVKIDWNCNLDRHIKTCRPTYSFARLDSSFREQAFSVGFNFRFASHWKHRRKYLRSLKKAFGLRLIICVSGKAGKFDIITLTLNTGSLVGIFGLATFVCDIILLNLTRKASLYRNLIIQRVDMKNKAAQNMNQTRKDAEEPLESVYENLNARDELASLSIWTSQTANEYFYNKPSIPLSLPDESNQLARIN